MKRLKYAVQMRRARVEGPDDSRPYIGLENIESANGRFVRCAAENHSAQNAPESGESLGNTFEPGDVLFGKLCPYLAKAWISEFPGRCSTELLVMDPREFDPRFLRNVCLSRGFVDAVDASTFGSKMPRADWDFIGNMPVPVPPLPQQQAIADYLDRETARLDALVAEKERLLDLLAEKRRALITHAVTRGVFGVHASACESEVPPSGARLGVPALAGTGKGEHPKGWTPNLRDSGLPWLGQVPAHWRTARAKWLFRERDQRSVSGEEVLLSLRMVVGFVRHNDVSEKQTRSGELFGYKKCSPGEIVLNRMRACCGIVAVAPEEGLVSPDYAVFKPSPDTDSDYYAHLFRTELLQAVFRSESTGLGTGSSGFLRLYSENFLALWLPQPP